MTNWSDLSYDILTLIMDRFSETKDIYRFGMVCQQWRSASLEKRQFIMSKLSPWLMYAEREDSNNRGFYSLTAQKTYYWNLPEARGRRCWSSHGWLITFGLDLEIHLLNPLSGVRFQLPSQPTFPNPYSSHAMQTPERLRQVFIKRMVLSSTPSEQCVVIAIYSEFSTLAFSRLGDEVWTVIESPVDFHDVIYFDDHFYAVDGRGRLFICDISSPKPKTILFAEPGENVYIYDDDKHIFYLVESLGELFLIYRDIIDFYCDADDQLEEVLRYKTVGFDVYEFDFESWEWMTVNSLDDRSLFLGNNNSFFIYPSNQHPGYKPNHICFTDSYHDNLIKEAGRDMGLYKIKSKKIKYLDEESDYLSYFSPALWICLYL
ncbi:hypothetical protein NE237_028398 [Protea cynaroides]|uniref:KIB1-4 beta-propeller domain-containing protein n=1 Tax=Protea cynaroides TaxID=273540 RepID=A0A9Q0GR34_9MAGN|nr:hypothetical protein NE237_028398 [Protea cynaroides]